MDEKSITIKIYSHSGDLPAMESNNFFHSPELFKIIENTPGHRAYMFVAFNDEHKITGHLMAIVRRHGSFMPPYIYSQGRIYGEGEYADWADRDKIFHMLLQAVTKLFMRKLCLYIEFSNISSKMFGYQYFRKQGYFPINWQEVHNSPDSISMDENLTEKVKKRISKAYNQGIITREAENNDEISAFYKILKNYFKMNFRRFIPPECQIQDIGNSSGGRVLVTIYKGKVIGGSVLVYSEGDAYMWYMASKRKTYLHLHPGTLTIWYALKHSWENNYAHLFFLDAGLPFTHNPMREFLLSFGGMPVTKLHWFKFFFTGLNGFLSWFFRE